IEEIQYFDCTLVSTPMDTSEKLMPNNGQAVSQLEYSMVIGCLMYAMTYTMSDIAFVVGKLSKQFKSDASWINNTEGNLSTSGWGVIHQRKYPHQVDSSVGCFSLNIQRSICSLCYLFRNPFSSTTMGDENPIRTLRETTPNLATRAIGIPSSSPQGTTRYLFGPTPSVQIFYDRIDYTIKRTVDYAAGGRLRKMSEKKAWATIEELARYEDEGLNDPIVPEKEGLNYENPDLEQLLRIMECKVETLMDEAITLMGRCESIFGISNDMMHQLPLKPSRQEAFEYLVMNFILDQEEKVKQLEEYMGAIGSDFMQLSLKVEGKLKE
nr:hypothetical protein [Tanacetum cinerariifolium]